MFYSRRCYPHFNLRQAKEMSVESLVSGIQQRFGYQTLRRASELMGTRATLSTGMDAVDELLDGGLLQGCGA